MYNLIEAESFNDTQIEGMLNEVFDGDKFKYPVNNLHMSSKTPHIFGIPVPGKEDLIVRFGSYHAKGDVIRQMKRGDKFVQVQIAQLSKNGNPTILKGGLGSDPIGAMATIGDLVLDVMKGNHLDAALVRFPVKQLQGQARTLARIAARIVQKRSGGVFQYIPGMAAFQDKYLYLLIVRKSKFNSMSELNIDPELYDVVPAAVGDVVIDKKTGEKVTKEEAKVASLAKREDKKSPRDAIKGLKIDRIELQKSFQILWKPGDEDLSQRFDDASVFAVKPEPNPVVDNLVETMNMAFSVNVKRRATTYYRDRGVPVDSPLIKFVEKMDKMPTAEDIRKIAALAADTPMNAETNSVKVQMAVYPFLKLTTDSFEATSSNMMKVYNADTSPEAKKMKAAIADYCGDYSSAMNDVFIKNMDDDEFLYKKIENMDKAFLRFGAKLPEGTTVYRTMSVNAKLANISLDNKKFYFSNYVSTSLKPFMFGMPQEDGYSLDVSSEEFEKPKNAHNVFGFAINGVDMPVLVPGPLSGFQSECEVILPRGTVVEFEKVYRGPDTKDGHVSRFWVEGKATNIKSIAESETVYDGDHLMETGELRVVEGFVGFADSLKPAPKYSGGELLADAISLENVPFKYIQA